jgi:hypothetical protein
MPKDPALRVQVPLHTQVTLYRMVAVIRKRSPGSNRDVTR